MLNLNNRSAYLQLDFMFAGLIFLLLMVTVFSYYSSGIGIFDEDSTRVELKSYARDLCFLFVESPGFPNNWDEGSISDIKVLGLKNSSVLGNSELSNSKLLALESMNYSSALNVLNLTDAFFNIKIYNISSQNLLFKFGVDSNIFVSSERAICFSRLNESLSKVVVEVWK